MDFAQADARFRQLETLRASGQLSEAGYRAELDQLRVYDQQGRLWMPQEGTGDWYVYVDGAWQAATPPRSAPPPPPAAARRAPVRQAPARSAPVQPNQSFQPQAAPRPHIENSGCAVGKVVQYGIAWVVIFAIIAIIIYFVSDKNIEAVYGVGLAALISALIMFFRMIKAYEGRITDIRTVESTSYDDDGNREVRRTTYAYLLQPDGKTKKVPSGHGWQIGDYIVKQRGHMNAKKIEE